MVSLRVGGNHIATVFELSVPYLTRILRPNFRKCLCSSCVSLSRLFLLLHKKAPLSTYTRFLILKEAPLAFVHWHLSLPFCLRTFALSGK